MRCAALLIVLACLTACDAEYDPLRLTMPACRPPSVEQGVLTIGSTSFEPYQVQASAVTDAAGRPALSFRLDDDGAEQLRAITASSIGETLPLRVDEEVLMSPRVMETITDGEILVAGDFEAEQLKALALRLSPPCDEEHP